MMMSLILYTLVSSFYLIHLIIELILSSTLAIERKEEGDKDNNVSLYANPNEEIINGKEKRQQRDHLLSNAMEFIQSWISVTFKKEVLSNSFDAKSIILNHSGHLFNLENDSYGLAYSLSVLITSALNVPTIPLQCILFLTHALRVSTAELPNFILRLLSNNPIVHNIKEKQLELLQYNNYTLSTSSVDTNSVYILEKLHRLQAELWLTLPNHITPFTVSPTLSKRNSITSIDSSSSYSTNNSTVTSFTSNNDSEDTHYKLFNFMEDDGIISERLNPFNTPYDDLIAFKSKFYDVKSKIDATLKYDQGLKSLHKSSFLQVENAVHSTIQNCNYMEKRLMEFQSGYVFSQLYRFILSFIVEAVHLMERSEREKAVIDHIDIINLESWVFNILQLVEALSQAFPLPTYSDKVMELSHKSQDLLVQFKMINDAWYKVDEIKSLLMHGRIALSTLDLSDNFLSRHGDQALSTVQHVQINTYAIAHKAYQVLTKEAFENTLHNTSSKALSCHERLVSALVYSVQEDLQAFKNDLVGCSLIIQKYFNKQALKRDIEHASHWLKTFKCNLVTFCLLEGCSSTTYENELLNFQLQYDEFVLCQYNEICEYFTRYSLNTLNELYNKKNIEFDSYQVDDLNYQQLGDTHLHQEYQWFVNLQTLCDETNHSLKVLNVLCQ